MAKHKPMCLVLMLLVIVGAINWGLVGLGGLIGNPNLNLVHLLLGNWPMVENIVYLLVGVAGVGLGVVTCTMKDCGCQKMDK